MEVLIGFLLLSFMLVLIFCVLVLFAYQIYLSPAAVRRQGIRLQARADYEHARGTAHLRILREAHHRKDAALKQCDKQITAGENRAASLEREQQERLREALERHLAYSRLTEVKGIGPKMRDRIIAVAFRSRLADLSQAYRVQGVGATRQQAINAWIQYYAGRIPLLLNEDFPGKQEILANYRNQLDDLGIQITHLSESRDRLGDHLKRLNDPINELQAVGVKEFIKALRDPLHVPADIDKYLIGLFPEWEPTPEWFNELTAMEMQ